MGIYNSDGTIATTTVDGLSFTGLYAADGSINIVLDDTDYSGLYHPCGALRVSSSTGHTVYDPSGAMYSNNLIGNPRGATTGVLEYFILSSDVATDCDDLAALGILVRAIRENPSKRLIAAVTDSPVPWAAPAMKAALEAYGLSDVPVGAYQGATGPTTSTYAANVAYMWGHGGETRDDFSSASTVIRTALNALPEGAKATVITIGMLGALYEFVQSAADEDGIAATGAELFTDRVLRVVSQGPNWANNLPRYNWEQNETAASHFTTNAATYGVPFVILPADEGDGVFTGPPVEWSQYDNPIARTFALSSSQLTDGERQAWDPLTVYYAIDPDNAIWAWHRENCSVTYDTGANTITKGAADTGLFSWINLNGTDAAIGDELSAYLAGLDDYQTPAAPDENAGYVVLDYSFEGEDASTTIVDNAFGRTATVSGATIQGNELRIAVAGGYVQLPDNAHWHLADQPFTFQLRGVRFDVLTGATRTLLNQFVGTGDQRAWVVEASATGALNFFRSLTGVSGSGGSITSSAGVVAINTSYDLDFVRTAGNDIKIFVDGVEVISTNIGTESIFNSNAVMRVGYRSDGVNGFVGFIDSIRLLKGVAEIPA